MIGFLKNFKMRYKEKHSITLANCDGYSVITDEELVNEYKHYYHWIKKEDKILFHFIYKIIHKKENLCEKCIIFIPKKKTITEIDGKKTLS